MEKSNMRCKKAGYGIACILIIIMVVMLLYNIFFDKEVQGYTYTDSNNLTWYFTISGENAYNLYLQSGTISGDTLTIPSEVTYNSNTYKVVGIRGYSTSTSTSSSYRQNILYYPIRSTSNYRTSITKIVIPDGVTTIGNNTFANMRGVTEIVLPDSVTSIGSYAFYNCTAATSIDIGDGVLSIGTYAFNGCTVAETLNIGTNVQTISDYAFANCRNVLQPLTIPNTTTTIGQYAFSGCSNLTLLQLGENVKSIGNYAFNNCRALTGNVTIPNATTNLGKYALANTDITSINTGNGITILNDYTFSNCSNLETIICPAVTTIGNNVFYSSGISGAFTIPNTVKTIGNNAFGNCNKLTEVNIGTSVTSLSSTAFTYCSKLENINVDSANTTYSSIGGILFNKEQTLLILCPSANVKTNYVVPSTVTSIEPSAFSSCLKITGTITLPETLETIGANAFYFCNGLTGTLKIPSSVKTINNSAFSYCTGFTKLQLANGLETIGNSAFQDCKNIKGDLIIPDSVTSIGTSAFANCTGFDGVLKTGNGVTTINSNVFQKCSNFYKAIVGTNVTSMGYAAFEGFENLWIERAEGTVSINTYVAGSSGNVYIHWLGCTHKINISTLPGVKLVNASTSEVIESGSYACETSFDYKIHVEEGYNYNNLKLITISDNNTETAQSIEVNTNTTYRVDRLIKDYTIYVQNISSTTDFNINTFITQRNRVAVPVSREPKAEIKNGEFVYTNEQEPLLVKDGDLLTCTVRVYNEGILGGKPGKVSIELPEGLKFVENNRTNSVYGWSINQNGNIETSYLSNIVINGYDGTKELKYEDIEVLLQVKVGESGNTDQDKIYEYTAKVSDSEDKEFITLVGQIKVDYTIKLNKIDADTKELLEGAEFELQDAEGNSLGKSTTNDSGTLDFGVMTTYGAGQDIYYIEEIGSPEGYMLVERTKIKVTVNKTVIDEIQGTYSVEVTCEVLDYNKDTTRYEFTPIKTREQLAKIGSGETLTIDGVEYQYNANTNYKIMNDIDLSGKEWVPISNNVKGIIDGDGHKIKNLTITSTEEFGITEVGLFRSFSGVIENLTLENVNIDIQAISEDALTISDHPCVGGFAGYMIEGTIRNCTVSGNISAVTDNIGGFVGHTKEEYIVKMQNCTNNANVTGKTGTAIREGVEVTVTSSNVGGLIGCALGALSITDCNNTGAITNTNYNAGGLVGFVQSTNYQEANIIAEFDETDKVIELIVENKKTTGKYDIIIENVDAKTLGLIEGAVYTILDKNQKVLNGFENVQLLEGRLKVATVDINSLGVDTYYIKEVAPAEGYSGLLGFVKLEVSRYWDKEAQNFKVAVNTEVLSNTEIINDEPTVIDRPIASTTGNIFTKVIFENVSWNVNKAEIKNSTNSGKITTYGMNAGGILGTTYSIIEIDNCENRGIILADSTSYGKAGGIVSEIRTKGLNKFSKITNCNNTGSVCSAGGVEPTGGIVAHNIGDIEFKNCTNSGEVSGIQSGVGGILGDLNGNFIAEDCKNSGKLSNIDTNKNTVNSVCGGILGKNYVYSDEDKNANSIYIDNCESTGEIHSTCHTGGIVGIGMSPIIEIKNCITKDTKIYDCAGDKGGVIGFVNCTTLKIDNCITENVELIKDPDNAIPNSTYGATGGVVGNLCKYGAASTANFEYVCISNCNTTDSKIITLANEAGGILGETIAVFDKTNINIFDCVVANTEIKNQFVGSVYANAAGIFASSYEGGNIAIDNCLVNTCNISSSGNGHDANVGGIMGMGWYSRTFSARKCEVIDCNLLNDANRTERCTNIGGIVSGIAVDSSVENSLNIDRCKVINTDMTTNAGNLGGIVALYYEYDNANDHLISNCTVEGGTFLSTADTGSNTCTGGIGGMMFGRIKVKNCTVDGTSITGNGRNTAGHIAVGYQNTTIEDSAVKNANIQNLGQSTYYSSPISVCDCVAGSVGYINGEKAIFKNVNIENTNIIGNVSIANVSGICAATGAYNEGKFEDCTVTGGTITSDLQYVQYMSNATVSGICGRTNATYCTINRCNVEETEFNGKGTIIAGMLASCNGFIANDCNIEDITINDTSIAIPAPYNYRTIGGIIGSATSNGNIMNNCNVNGLEVNNAKIKTSGGLVAFALEISNLNNCIVDGFTITNNLESNATTGSLGGLVGDTSSTIVINNSKTQNSELTGNSENIGGIIGAIISPATINGTTVKNVDLINKNTYNSEHGNVGGFIGTGTSDVIITEGVVEDSNITINNGATLKHHAGGIIGFTYDTTITNTDIKNSKIINNTTNGNTGGLVGMTQYLNGETPIITTLITTNSGITNTDVIGKEKSGGIIGFGKLNSVSGYVNNATIKAESAIGEIGGAIGNGLAEGQISEIDVENSSLISGYRAGGIAGYAPMNITSCDVLDSEITVTAGNGDIGGIVANASNTSSEISKCNVTNSTITANNTANAYIGGIAGFANNTISECNVTNCIINALSTTARGLGGILGHGSNYTTTATYIYKCIVSGTQLSGVSAVGGIAGAAVPNIEECTVTGIITQESQIGDGAKTEGNQLNAIQSEENLLDKTITQQQELQESEEESQESDEEPQEGTEEPNYEYENPVKPQEITTQLIDVYSSIIKGTDSVGGIIGDAGILVTGNTFTTLKNCTINNTNIIGATNVSEGIGKNSKQGSDPTIYDVIINLIKTNCKLTIE